MNKVRVLVKEWAPQTSAQQSQSNYLFAKGVNKMPFETPFPPAIFAGTIDAVQHEHSGVTPPSIIRTDQSWAVNVSWTTTGLATGMAVALLVGLWIWDELSFNSNHQNHSQLAQVMLSQTSKGETYTGETVAMPLGEALRNNHSGDFKYVSLTSWNNDHILAVGNNKLPGAGRWVQPDFPEMFTLSMCHSKGV